MLSMVIASWLASDSIWYGPVWVTIPATVSGNPFDPVENDVRVRFIGKGGTVERLGYYSAGRWRAVGAAPNAGSYRVEFWRNGKLLDKLPTPIQIAKPAKADFVRAQGNRFLVDGKPYWPVGHNLGWQAQGDIDMTSQLIKMGQNGCNWARIWASSWDAKNPFWPGDSPVPKDGWMSEVALDRWDQLVEAAEKSGIRFQMVFFYHGAFSTAVNPNWPTHPWNKANGGFLSDAKDFFTDPEAKRRTKIFLRYAVARWGHSSAIMAWELWNEVQFTDLARAGGWSTIGAWHDEMADFLRSIDPYKHLVTTSSELNAPIWRKMDYLQGHGYPASLPGLILGQGAPKEKPMFFGEVGLSGDRAASSELEAAAVRDGIWSAYLAGQSGAGEYWYWDRMKPPIMYEQFARAKAILSKLPPGGTVKATVVGIDSPTGGNLVLRPGRGWDASAKMEFELPAEADAASFGKLSAFVQGEGHRDMQPKHLKFSFNAAAGGEFRLHVSQISQAGAHLRVSVNGAPCFDRKWDSGNANKNVDLDIEAPFADGDNAILVENIGTDWVVIDRYEFPGLAPLVSSVAVRAGDVSVLRLTGKAGTSIRLSGISSTAKKAEFFDLDSSKSRPIAIASKGGIASFVVPYGDQIVRIQ